MTTFTGTLGTDTFVGADYVQDIFYFDTTTLDGTDIVVGGANTGTLADVMHLDAGTYVAADFAGVSGIDSIHLDGPSTLYVDSALISQGGIAAHDGRLNIRTSSGDDVIDASGATGNGLNVTFIAGNDTIVGSEDSDQLFFFISAVGNVTFFGGGGDDQVYVGGDLTGPGIHDLDGGTDVDDLHLSGVGTLVLDLQAAGFQFDIGGVHQGTLAGFERYYAQTDDATMLGSSGADEFHGSAGDDVLSGRGGDDILSGGEGTDSLRGGIGDDILDGGAGIDTADYANSGDRLDVDLQRAGPQATGSGATGTDTLIDIENLIGGSNDDILAGDAGDNRFEGRGGADTLLGRDGDDILFGYAGDDVLDGGTGDDTMAGGAGDDSFIGGIGTDTLGGGNGTDVVDYSAATTHLDVNLFTGLATDGVDRFHTLHAIESVIGGGAGDAITGEGGDNLLLGLDGDDTLVGQGGADTLIGGSGLDLLIGGADADVFVFSDTGAGFGDDVVDDFEDGIDTLQFIGVSSVSVTDVGANAQVTMYDALGSILDTVVLNNAAGLIDASDYTLLP